LIAAMLSSLPISNQFSSSIPRRGENFQPYVKANPKLIHSATLSNILRPKWQSWVLGLLEAAVIA